MEIRSIFLKTPCVFALFWLLANTLAAQQTELQLLPGSFKAPPWSIFWQNNKYVWRDDTLYLHHPGQKRWQLLLQTPEPVQTAFVYYDQLILSSRYTQHLYRYDKLQNKVLPFTLPVGLLKAQGKNIRELNLSAGSYGCFHNSADSIIYRRRGKWFFRTNKGDETTFSKKLPQKLPAHAVETLLDYLDNTPQNLYATPLAAITPADIEAFRLLTDPANPDKHSDSMLQWLQDDFFFPENDSELEIFRSLIDSVAMLDDQTYRELFRDGLGLISTTTNWRSIHFVLEDKRAISVHNADFLPHYQMTPWQITFDGAVYEIHNGAFARQLDNMTNRGYFQQPYMDKQYLIYRIVCALYRRKHGE